MESTNSRLLNPLLEAGYQLIPLHRFDHFDQYKGTKRERGKSPLHANWTKRTYTSDNQLSHMDSGANVGVRLKSTELVIDVDPRAFPEGETLETPVNPFVHLCKDTNLDRNAYPTVKTGSGGLHLYMRKPENALIRDSLAKYPGVEFKSLGRQVVAAGSIHPKTKRTYRWIKNEPLDDMTYLGVEAAPDSLIDLIQKTVQLSSTSGGEHNQKELAAMLDALEPEDFRVHDEWLTLMQACHHATSGIGRSEFIEWSTRDPVYRDDGILIGRRWDSLHSGNNNCENKVTHRTLHKILRDSGKENFIPRTPPEDDFDDLEDGDIPAAATRFRNKRKIEPLPNKAPITIAEQMLKDRPILRSGGYWLEYESLKNSYREVDAEEFLSIAWCWINDRKYRTAEGVKKLEARSDLISNVTSASMAVRQGPRNLPSWKNKKSGDPNPQDLLAVENGLLHLPTMQLLPPTPRFVNRNASPVQYDPNANTPTRWNSFLKEVYKNDDETISTLQEVMGYLLTQDTSQQKVFCMVGPPRSGKGTINRILQNLIGEGNYSSPNAKMLSSGDFGLQSLIGKQLAVISDMRMGRNSDPTSLSENLLRISGEDEVSINRKYKDAWEGKLSTRFLLLSNETPQFRDTSGAIITRMILIKNSQSFLEKEDPGLTNKLRNELSGILNWALEGLQRLRERGHFIQPNTSKKELSAMMTLASPVKAFAKECLSTDPNSTMSKDHIWIAFSEWIDEMGLPYHGDPSQFFKGLGTVGLNFRQTRPIVDGKRVQSIIGLALRDY